MLYMFLDQLGSPLYPLGVHVRSHTIITQSKIESALHSGARLTSRQRYSNLTTKWQREVIIKEVNVIVVVVTDVVAVVEVVVV